MSQAEVGEVGSRFCRVPTVFHLVPVCRSHQRGLRQECCVCLGCWAGWGSPQPVAGEVICLSGVSWCPPAGIESAVSQFICLVEGLVVAREPVPPVVVGVRTGKPAHAVLSAPENKCL